MTFLDLTICIDPMQSGAAIWHNICRKVTIS